MPCIVDRGISGISGVSATTLTIASNIALAANSKAAYSARQHRVSAGGINGVMAWRMRVWRMAGGVNQAAA